jgi:hypothetical protein
MRRQVSEKESPMSRSLPWLAVLSLLPVLAGCADGNGESWRVSTIEQLYAAIEGCAPGEQIVMAPGEYHVTKPLYLATADVVVRGRTGKPEQVVLHGNGMNKREGMRTCFWMAADGVQLRDLTIRDFWQYGVVLSGWEPARALPDRLVLSNLRIQNCGTRHIKAVYSKDDSEGVLIEKVHCFQTEKRQRRPGHPVDPDNYIGGIDCMKTKDWIIRDCRFENIRGATGGGRGAIFMWISSVNPLIERNVIVNCGAAICLGNGHNPEGVYHVSGGVVRNNFIYHASSWRAVELGYIRGAKFVHNTLYADRPDARAIDIYDRPDIPTKELVVRNNLIRGRIHNRARGQVILADNLSDERVGPDWFVDPPSGKLFLTKAAGEAVDRVQPLPEVPQDITGRRRPAGRLADFGAHERR